MYKDRGIIKWAPFSSLTPHKDSVNNMSESRNNIKKPQLSEDQLNNLNELLSKVNLNKDELYIEYFKNNNINHLSSKLIKLDHINKKLILENKMSLDIKDILLIEFI